MYVIYLVCASVIFVSIKSQPLFQTLPTQYQQNGYQIFEGAPVAPANNNPYYQVLTNQNTGQVSQTPSLSHQLSQIFVNRLFTNPAIKTILDPNTRMVNQHGVEVTRHIPNTQNNQNTPNVVNNYIIVPPEYLNFNETVRNNQKPVRNNRNNHQRLRNEDHRIKTNEVERGIENSRNANRRKPKRPNNDVPESKREDSQQKTNRNEAEERKPKAKRNRNRDNDNKNDSTRQRTNEREIKEKNNSETVKRMSTQSKPNVYENVAEIPVEIVRPINNSTLSNKQKTGNTSNKPLNPKHEKAIKEFRQKYPGIPEEVLRDLIEHMKKQMNDYNLGSNPFFPPMNYPFTFDQLFGHYNNFNNNVTTKPKRRRKNKNQRKRKGQRKRNKSGQRNDDNKLKTTTPASTTTKEEKSNPVVTEKPVKETTTELNIEVTSPNTYNEIENIQNLENTLKALEFDAEVQKIVDEENELMQEYYPDFKNDNRYLTSEEERELKHLDDRYYYTTDRNYEIDDRDGNFHPTHYVIPIESGDYEYTEDTIMKPDQVTERSYENNSPRPEESQTVHFMTPPPLEMVDFETKPVDKERFKVDKFERPIYDPDAGFTERIIGRMYTDDTDKYSSYSKFKNSYTGKTEKKNFEKKVLNDVETVFAHSKVVKYGVPDIPDIEEVAHKVSDVMNDKVNVNKGTTFVIAESYPDQLW